MMKDQLNNIMETKENRINTKKVTMIKITIQTQVIFSRI